MAHLPASESHGQSLQILIERARADDRIALDRLGRHFEPLVRAQVGRIMGPYARRWEDSASMTNLVLHEVLSGVAKLPPGAGQTELLARLRRTASSRVIDLVRAHEHRHEDAALDADKPVTAAVDRVLRYDELRWLLRHIGELPDLYAPVVRMRLGQSSLTQIAEKLGRSVDTVRKQYARGCAMLEQRMRAERERQ